MGTEKSGSTAGHTMNKHLWAPATIRSSLSNLWADERGATAIEYGLIAAMIVVVVIAGMQAVGDAIKINFYDKIMTIF
jgi:pilus assembly protein Flp/PilA